MRSQSLLTRRIRSKQLLHSRRRCKTVPMPVGGGAHMTFQVIHSSDGSHARSPFRVIEQPSGREVDWINRFLDREPVRPLAKNTHRSSAIYHFPFLLSCD